MRLRLLAFLPIAGVITFALLLTAASLVSALERSVVPADESAIPFLVSRYETECERLMRAMHALTEEASSCEVQTACVGSPLLCPVAQDASLEAEFQRLRTGLNERCGYSLGLLDITWTEQAWTGGANAEAPSARDVSTEAATSEVEGPRCGPGLERLEAALSGEAGPSRFVF